MTTVRDDVSTWLITGCSTGIGREIALAALAKGHRVAATARNPAAIEDIVTAYPEQAIALPLDVTDARQIANAVSQTEQAFEAIDVLVNNAGYGYMAAVEEGDDAEVRTMFDTNYFGAVDLIKAVLPGMRAKGGGSIISLGSISWHLGLPDLVLYQTSKAAIEGLTRSLARDLGPDNIRVNCVVPGNVKTPRQEQWYTPEGEAEIVKAQCIKHRLGPEDVAALVVFLASDDAKGMTGHEYFVDAGWR